MVLISWMPLSVPSSVRFVFDDVSPPSPPPRVGSGSSPSFLSIPTTCAMSGLLSGDCCTQSSPIWMYLRILGKKLGSASSS